MKKQTFDILNVPLEGRHLIEASAGTGKTYTLAGLYLRMVLERCLEVKNILVVTFTEAATKELRDRIRTNLQHALTLLLSPETEADPALKSILENAVRKRSAEDVRVDLRRAVTSFDEASVFTIHGFCRRVLSDFSFESSTLFETELIKDQQKLIQEITDDFWRKHFSQQSPILSGLTDYYDLSPSSLVSFSKLVLNLPTLMIIPDIVDDPAERIMRVFEELKQEWRESASRIMGLLYDSKGLSRSKTAYKKELLDSYIESLRENLEAEPQPSLFSILKKFSARTLNDPKSLKGKGTPPQHRFFDLCDKCIDSTEGWVIWTKKRFAEYLKTELRKRKQQEAVQSFDDLLCNVRDILLSDRKGGLLLNTIQKTYKVALIDEFQDTDPVQFDIFATLFDKNSNIYYIGDPKQAIYAFRGADVFSYIKASQETPAANCHTLSTNWRSERDLIGAVNRFFTNCENPFVIGELIDFIPSAAAKESKGNKAPLVIRDHACSSNLVLWWLKKENPTSRSPFLSKENALELSINATVQEVSTLLDLSERGEAWLGERKLLPSDIAVLVLKNDDAVRFKHRLDRLNIPAVISKSGDVFKTDEARELFLVLLAVAFPNNPSYLNTALSTSMLGFDAETIRSFVEEETRLEDYEFHINRFAEYHEIWRGGNFIRMFRRLLADYEVRERLLVRTDGERRLTNILHLSELIHIESISRKYGPNGILNWLTEQWSETEESEERELRLERDDEAVQITTVYKSKGLQYPVVFCPCMWQRGIGGNQGDIVFHRDNKLFLDLGSANIEAGAEQSDRETLSELVRLLYVAVTRAQNRCYMTIGRMGQKNRPILNAVEYVMGGGIADGDNLVQRFETEVNSWDEDRFLEAIRRRFGQNDSVMSIADPPDSIAAHCLPAGSAEEEELVYTPCSATNRMMREWGIASYSRLTAGESAIIEHAEEDSLLLDESETSNIEVISSPEDAFFEFPAGRTAGSCIHEVFENIDFSLDDSESTRKTIRETLLKYGLEDKNAPEDGETPREEMIYRMVSRVLQTPLDTGSTEILLGRIPAEQRLIEQEFYFPIHRLTPELLKSAFDNCKMEDSDISGSLPDRIGRLQFKPISGYMHGFIDLMFMYEGKYYLLDWKTNHLGADYSEYAPERLKGEMIRNLYVLQYTIYSVALHKYLTHRLPGYQFDTHFGGVFYLFVRGITPNLKGNGIFFERPLKECIFDLSKALDAGSKPVP